MKRFAVLIFVLLFAAGCGNQNVQLRGTVTFEDGTPLTMGAVIFSTETFMAGGSIDSEGRFVMGSYGMSDGLPPGTYKVYIAGAVEELGGGGSDLSGMTQWSLIDPKFGNFATTPLTCEVPAPRNTFDIVVPRNPTPRPN